MKKELIEKHILQLENELLKLEIRKSSQKINELIAEDFIEFTSSGGIYHYKKGDVFLEQNDNRELIWEILDFQVKQLAEGCILAMYKIIKHSEKNENKKYSLRSSIWKYNDGKWKMLFHQGTLTSSF